MRILAVASLLATGCATAPATAGDGKCDAAKAEKLVGRTRSAEVGKAALRLTGATALRWIAPGMAVTMDYRENRVNLRVDPAGKVVRITCG